MSRVHDMGGRFGDGPVAPDGPDAPVFAEDWHKRALAITLASGALGQWNLDTSRHARERLSPKDYTRFSYYEKWLAGLATLLVETGVVTKDELAGAEPQPSDLAERALPAAAVSNALAKGGPSARALDRAPRFAVGDTVSTRHPAANAFVPGGHTRLPGYAAGMTGRVLACHGPHVLPDANAHGRGEAPEPLYAVALRAEALWGTAAEPGDEVVLDLWESYLEPA